MSFKTAAARFGNALVDVANEMHNSKINAQIDEINEHQSMLRVQLARLEENRSELKQQLI